MFYLVQALYQHHTGYTGTSLYESWSLSVFNTLFTSLPVIFLGIFEKDLAASTLLAVPELYVPNQKNAAFNFGVYVWWMALAAVESVVIFFTMEGLYGSVKGELYTDSFTLGDMCYTAAVIVIACKLQLLTMHNVSFANLIAIILSVGGWFVWNLLISGIYSNNTEYDVKGGFTTRFGRSGAWWLTLIVGLSVVAVVEIAVETIRAAYFTSDEDVFRQLERDPVIKARFEQASRMELQAGWDAAERARKKSKKMEGEDADDDEADEYDDRDGIQRKQDVEEILRKRAGPYHEGNERDQRKRSLSQHRHQSRRSLGGRHSEAIDRKGTRMPGISPPPPPLLKGLLKKSRSLGHITGMYETGTAGWNEKAGSSKKGAGVEVREV
jgi:phospholipid-translocating ATPase